MKLTAVVMFFLLMTTAASAANLESRDAAKKLTDNFMDKIASGNIEGGLLLMKPYTITPEAEFKVMSEQARLQLPAMQGRLGQVLGTEFIREKMVGKSLLQIIQIQKFEKSILRWSFIFYNPDGRWILNTFGFDDKIQTMFED